MKTLLTLNKYFLRYKWRLTLGIAFVGISNYFAVYSITFIRKGIDYIKDINLADAPADISNKLLFFALMTLGMALLQGFFLFLMRQTIIVMSRLIEYDLKNDVYEHYQKLDTGFYKRNSTGDLMNRISEDVGRVRMYIGPSIMYIVNTIMTFVFTIGIMINIDSRLTLYVLLPLPVLAFSIYYVSATLNKKGNKVQEQLSKLSTIAQEAFSGIRIIKSFSREANWNKDFERESELYKDKNMDLVKTDSLFQPFMILMIGLSTIATIYIGGKEAIDEKITVGNIAEFIIYVNRLTWPVASLGWVTSLVQRAAASQQRINEFLNTEPGIRSPTDEPFTIKGGIELKNVSFTYKDSGLPAEGQFDPQARVKALNDVSFTIPQGKSLAIIGRTGSGKSTIANLLCRLYDVDSGEILIDGNNIKTINLYDLRDQLGYVPQEVFLFSDSIAANIGFSAHNTGKLKTDRSMIEQAAKDAAIYASIINFPEKFDTVVGERGITLSGGQKQRISIARAIIREPRLLIFDDCLSAVDTETEEEILNNLNRLMRNKTTIVISHRVSSVKHADHIIVLDHGSIVEQGSHHELLGRKGIYFELHQKQLLEKENSSI
ncbi:MAG: ABC transporter ATP-binding protein [Bacteroidetes bacterium]|nr:ABC transporter ATP-binding protein [Bacteroidota bacterium]